jgi:anti-sigma regulatory factor (Ser/Thr protein kinase)|nr:ATP-binding protein [Herbaspirillum sp. B39]|tara:strand:- start:3369 stop:3878 length:510 start_codon:yes stop_codon:yes gene_type:complete
MLRRLVAVLHFAALSTGGAMAESKELLLQLHNDVAELDRLAEAVDEFCAACALPGKLAFELNLVLEEVVVNVINYAFPDGGADEPIHVRVVLETNSDEGRAVRVVAEVRDTGTAFDPLLGGPPDFVLDLDKRPVGGLGVHFLKTLMDEVSYRRTERHNCLWFAKHVAGD